MVHEGQSIGSQAQQDERDFEGSLFDHNDDAF
jgi:hypothetical protein